MAKFDAAGSLVYSTYLGGSEDDMALAVAVNDSGSVYVAGDTQSPDFPTAAPFQRSPAGPNPWHQEGFVAKLAPDGSGLVYSTYLGGSGDDSAKAITVDASGNAYVGGSTQSTDFPTSNPLQPSSAGGGDAFLSKLSATGDRLVYSTYLGGEGEEEIRGVAIDRAGRVIAAGRAAAPRAPANAFVTFFDPSGASLLGLALVGGSSEDSANAVAVDAGGNAYLAGGTLSADFPGTRLGPEGKAQFSAFVAEVSLTMAGPAVYAVVNAASYSDAGFAPGTIIAIYGDELAGETQSAGTLPLPIALAGVGITINGLPAPHRVLWGSTR